MNENNCLFLCRKSVRLKFVCKNPDSNGKLLGFLWET